MSSTPKFKMTDINGNESSKDLIAGLVLGDLIKSNQVGLIDGMKADNSTTLRAGDHVEIIAKSGKAGC